MGIDKVASVLEGTVALVTFPGALMSQIYIWIAISHGSNNILDMKLNSAG